MLGPTAAPLGQGGSGAEPVPGLSSAIGVLGVSRHRGTGTWRDHA